MITLGSTTQSLEVKLGGTPSAELAWSASFVDRTSSAYSPEAQVHGLTTGATAATIITAPAASHTRQVKEFAMRNQNVADVTAIVQLADGATKRIKVQVVLSEGDALYYGATEGWYTLNSGGARKTVGTLANHATSHENGGSDEIEVTGLSGLLADPQTPLPQAGGTWTIANSDTFVDIAISGMTSAGQIAVSVEAPTGEPGDPFITHAPGTNTYRLTAHTAPGTGAAFNGKWTKLRNS